VTPHDIAQRIRSALDAERWGDYDVEAFPVGDNDTDVTIFVENSTTDESYEFLISIDKQG
jgi:hypothetical protein